MHLKTNAARLGFGPALAALIACLMSVVPLGQSVATASVSSVEALSGVAQASVSSAHASTVAPRLDWTESLARPSWIYEVKAASCSTTTTCLVAADELRRSTDGGVTWTPIVTPGLGYLTDVTCPDTQRCYAVNGSGELFLSNDGGTSWTRSLAVASLARLSCPSPSTCYGVTRAYANSPLRVLVTRDDGVTWTALSVPTITNDLAAFTCPSEIACRGTGEDLVLRTDDGGAHWAASDPSVNNDRFTGFACPTATDCIAVTRGSTDVWLSSDGGATWHPYMIFLSNVGGLTDVDCPSPSRCVLVGIGPPAVGGGVGAAATINLAGGLVAGSAVAAGANGLDIVRCRSSHCVAFGRDLVGSATGRSRTMISNDSGATFAAPPVPVAPSVSAIACPTVDRCIAVGQDGVAVASGMTGGSAVRTDDGGSTWASGQMFGTIGPLTSITCPSPLECLAVGTSAGSTRTPLIARSSTAGASWSVPSLPLVADSLTKVACPSAVVCLVGANVSGGNPFLPEGGRMLRSTDGGTTWSVNASWSPTGPPQIGSLDCLDNTRCFAVAGSSTGPVTSLWASVDAGATWTAVTPPTDRSAVFVRCQQSTCVLDTYDQTHGQEIYSTDAIGGAWVALPAGGYGAGRFCAASGECAWFRNDAGGKPITSADGGATWAGQTVPANVRGFIDSQCPAGGKRCFVVVRGGSELGTAIFRADLMPRALASIIPERLLDTRVGPDFTTIDRSGEGGGQRRAGAVTAVPVAGRAGLPVDTSSVALTVTVTEPAASGFVTVWPCGAERPTASNLNYAAGATVANTVVSKVGADGTVCIFNQVPTQLVVDVDAFMPAGSSVAALVPGRVLETRVGTDYSTVDHVSEGGGAPAAGAVSVVSVAGRAGVPADAAGVVLTVTVTEPAASGFVTVWPCGADRPTASNLNHAAGATVANTVVAKLGSGGSVCIYNQVPTHLVVDVDAYMTAGSHVGSVVPARLVDSRNGPAFVTIDHLQEGVGMLDGGVVIGVPVAGRGAVPQDAVSAVLTVTVTEPTASGFVTVWSCDGERPTASNLNYSAGATVANTVVTKLGVGGTVCIFTKSPTHLVVDVNGYE